jgi:hypothetical protein
MRYLLFFILVFSRPLLSGSSYDPKLGDWILDYLETIPYEMPLESVLDGILTRRASLMILGYSMPPVSELMPYLKASLSTRGIELTDEHYELLKEAFQLREKKASLPLIDREEFDRAMEASGCP